LLGKLARRRLVEIVDERVVVDVVDGDTVDIAYQNGTRDTVRLLGFDTPEVHTDVSPDEFEGVPDTSAGRQCLADYGEQASAFAEQQLAGETVTLQFDEAADRRGYYDRLIAYIIVDGTNFNYQLVADGYARVFDSPFSQSSRFYDAEAAAQADGTRVWSCRSVEDDSDDSGATGSGQFGTAQIHEDARGDEYDNLNDEYVVFENTGGEALDLSGWTVEDEAGATYEFPTGFTLQPGDEVTLHTGSGQDTSTDLYWGYERPIWNNSGDTVIVKNTDGNVVLREEYS
jgi:micrococcal nuclease